MRQLLRSLLVCAIPTALVAQGDLSRAVHIGRVDSVYSQTLKEQRRILVYTPPSYDDTTVAPQRYPVLYLLDGDAHFHSVTGLIQALGTGVNATYAVPEMIVVAIPNTDRTRDMTPTRVGVGFDGKPTDAFKTSGGMGTFFTFIKSELIPQVERTYRTTSYRVFIGHSLGGITALNALYTMPDVFNAYVAIDPSLWWDNNLLLRQAKPWISSAKLAGKALFVAQANTIAPDDTTLNPHYSAITQFNAVMKAYNQSGLRFAFRHYADDNHGSVPLIAEYDALRFIFEGYQPELGRVLRSPRTLVAHFRTVSERLGATFQPSEATLRLLAFVSAQVDSTKAIEFHEMATELYPQSASAWERLGTAAAARGDKARARTAFEQALSRNPRNAKAREQLEKLKGSMPGGA
jgi:hypothetical protein